MPDAQARAYERSSPGTGPAPVFVGPTKDALEGWRLNTPPIVESANETLAHVRAKQGREDNRGPS